VRAARFSDVQVGGGVTAPGALELAERALGFATGEAQATVVRERSLLSRFALSTPTQATQVERRDRLAAARPRRPHRLCPTPRHLRRRPAPRRGARRRRRPGGRALRRDPRRLPGPASAAPVRAHDGFDALTRTARPRGGGAALRAAFEGCARHGRRPSDLDGGAVETPSHRRGRSAPTTR